MEVSIVRVEILDKHAKHNEEKGRRKRKQ